MANIELIKCEFSNFHWSPYGDIYTCLVKNQSLDATKNYQFDLTNCQSIGKVAGVQFWDCEMPKIPENFPWHQFPNMQLLEICKSKLATIGSEDFKGLNKEKLKQIWFYGNDLEYIPGDLFDGMLKLERISFEDNKIKYIEAAFVDFVTLPTSINFRGNVNINLWFDEDGYGNATFNELKKIILEKCQVPSCFKDRLVNLNKKSSKYCEELQRRNDHLEEESFIQKQEIERLKEANQQWEQLKSVLKDENMKDFNVILKGHFFSVHKLLLIAKSPVLADMIRNNPKAMSLQLEKISLDIFHHILDFLYDDTLPQDGAAFKDIFIAASRLKIEKLKNYTGVKLIDQVDADNAFEMLSLANKYDHEDLKKDAFLVIKGFFPGRELSDEIASNEAKIQKLIKIREMQKEFERKVDEEFNELKDEPMTTDLNEMLRIYYSKMKSEQTRNFSKKKKQASF